MTSKYCYILAVVTLLISLTAPCHAEPYVVEGFTGNVDVNVTYNPNVSNAWIESDAMDDTLLNLSIGGAYSKPVSDSGLLVFSGYLGFRQHQEFDDLDSTSLSIDGRYYFQFKQGYLAPIYQFGLAYTQFDHAENKNRDGGLLTFKTGGSKRVNTQLFVSLYYEYKIRDADNKTYDTENSYLTLALEYRLSSKTTLYVDLQFERGELVSDADGVNGRFSETINAKAIVLDPVFDCRTGCENWSYRFEGNGVNSTIGIVFALTPAISLDLSARLYDWEGDSGIDSSDWSGMFGLIWHF